MEGNTRGQEEGGWVTGHAPSRPSKPGCASAAPGVGVKDTGSQVASLQILIRQVWRGVWESVFLSNTPRSFQGSLLALEKLSPHILLE